MSDTDYKALVCVFLFGGMDNHDTVLPSDDASYDRYAQIRASLLNAYGENSSRSKENLLELNGDYDGKRYALPSDLSGIHALFNSGEASIVANVGPLVGPLTKDQYADQSAPFPKRLFSHNDQQSTWQAGEPEGARRGWGGKFADVFHVEGADFIAMSGTGNSWLAGENVRPYSFTPSGAPKLKTLSRISWQRGTPSGLAKYNGFQGQFEAAEFVPSDPISADYADAMSRSVQQANQYNAALASGPELATEFPSTGLGGELRAVARTIAVQEALGVDRQVFFVGLGGFDTHTNQVGPLGSLQRQLDDAVVAFSTAMKELGQNENVTLFTASDFGRTLQPNGTGTDHGWGGHHFVVGGGINGGQIFGEMPPYDLGHDQDAGRGRLIPTTSVDQYAAGLGKLLGLTDQQIADALPDMFGAALELA